VLGWVFSYEVSSEQALPPLKPMLPVYVCLLLWPECTLQEEAMRAYVAYLGPFSPEAVAGKLDFAAGAITPPGTSGEKLRILATNKVCPQQD
jgi:hypothetical protein